MGIYSNGTIFGIIIFNFTNDNFSNVLFEKKYDKMMTATQKEQAYIFYTSLDTDGAYYFQICTECTSTYDISNTPKIQMAWYPLSLDAFLSKFSPVKYVINTTCI
jgi:hypothetical protein